MFAFIYEWLNGSNPNYPEYRSEVFRSVGLLTVLISISIVILFYLVLGRWRMIWFNTLHWSLTILFAGIIGFMCALLSARSAMDLVDGYMIRFALINGAFAALLFITSSFLIKPFSVFSRRTPF